MEKVRTWATTNPVAFLTAVAVLYFGLLGAIIGLSVSSSKKTKRLKQVIDARVLQPVAQTPLPPASQVRVRSSVPASSAPAPAPGPAPAREVSPAPAPAPVAPARSRPPVTAPAPEAKLAVVAKRVKLSTVVVIQKGGAAEDGDFPNLAKAADIFKVSADLFPNDIAMLASICQEFKHQSFHVVFSGGAGELPEWEEPANIRCDFYVGNSSASQQTIWSTASEADKTLDSSYYQITGSDAAHPSWCYIPRRSVELVMLTAVQLMNDLERPTFNELYQKLFVINIRPRGDAQSSGKLLPSKSVYVSGPPTSELLEDLQRHYMLPHPLKIKSSSIIFSEEDEEQHTVLKTFRILDRGPDCLGTSPVWLDDPDRKMPRTLLHPLLYQRPAL